MSLFERGQPKTPGSGRIKGTRNKLSKVFLEALAAEFEAHGANVIRICRCDKPIEFLKLIAGLLPRELEVTDSRLQDLSDDELDAVIEQIKRQISERAGEFGERTEFCNSALIV